MKKLRVTVEGKAYEVLVEVLDEVSAAAPRPAVSTPLSPPVTPVVAASIASPKAAAGAGDVVSPLAGKVVSIDVKLGQAVAAGAQVATVEAMKMNTFIYASVPGQVTAILVNPGDGVEEGTALLRIA